MPKEKQQSIILLAAVATVLTAVLLYLLWPALTPASLPVRSTRVYFADRISTAHRKIIDRFNELHEGKIEVVPVDLPFDKFSTNERKELLARSLRSRSDKLDIFSVDLIWVERFARWCEPLGQYFPRKERGDILPAALQSCYSDTTLVAMPLYIDIGVMYYRRDLLGRLPDADVTEARLRESMTWPEFLRLRDRLGYSGKPFYIFQADEYEGLVCNYLELVLSQDPAFLSSNRIDLDRPAARSALQLMVDLVHRQKTSPLRVTEFDEDRSYMYMMANDAVFVRGWPNFVEHFRKTSPDTVLLNHIRRAALPRFEGREATSVFGGWNLMLSKFSTRKPEALEFIRFLQTREAQEMLYENDGFLPVSNAIYGDSLYMHNHPELAYYRTLLTRGFHRPAMVDYTRISDILSHYLRQALRKELSVDDALREASNMIRSDKVLIK